MKNAGSAEKIRRPPQRIDSEFPYHFHDILDLLELQQHPLPVCHIFHSACRERLEQYIFLSIRTVFLDYLKREALPADGETVRSVADFCCFSFLGITLEFIWNRMEADVDKLVGRMNAAFDGLIESIHTVPDRATGSGASLAAAT